MEQEIKESIKQKDIAIRESRAFSVIISEHEIGSLNRKKLTTKEDEKENKT